MLEKLRTARDERLENKEGGFTLIELLVVVVIIGILVAIAIPLYLNYQKGAHDKSAQSDLRGAVSALQQCFTENNNAYPNAVASNNSGASVSWNCVSGTTTVPETANLSSGTSFVYSPKNAAGNACATTDVCTSYVITDTNSGGHGKTFTYDSTAGGQIS